MTHNIANIHSKSSDNDDDDVLLPWFMDDAVALKSRRDCWKVSSLAAIFSFVTTTTSVPWTASADTLSSVSSSTSDDSNNSNMFSPNFVQEYPDFIRSPQGWSYRDVIVPTTNSNNNKKAQVGDRVVFDWSGYTIGYFGRPFQAKG